MHTSRVSVASYTAALAKANRFAAGPGQPWTVWYLGNDYARLLRLKSELPPSAVFAPVSQAVNDSARGLLSLMLDLDGFLAGSLPDRAAWDASDIADRSRYNSPFFLELARVVAVLRGVGSGGRHVVIVDDDSFAMTVFDAMIANKIATTWHRPFPGWFRLRHETRNLISLMRRLLGDGRAGLRRLSSLRGLRAARPLTPADVGGVDVWIAVWATDKTFAAGAPLQSEDRVGRLPAILRTAGIKVGYLVFPLWPERYDEIASAALRCSEPVLLAEDALSRIDIVATDFVVRRHLPGVKHRLSWEGLDLSPVLKRALKQERISGRPMKARLLSQLPRLMARLGASPKAVVTTYENHSWEKVLTASVHRHMPSSHVIGYNHASFSSFYISLNPSPGDIAANVIPDCVLTLGQTAASDLAARGFPRDRLKVAGGLRYEAFFERARQLPPPPASGVRNVLCCVGVDLDEGVELVHKGAEAAAGSDALALKVNFHPMSGPQFRDTLKAMLRSRNAAGFERIQFDDRPVRDLLVDCHAVLYIDSNAALEAAAAGRQIIYVVRETGLDYDKMPPGLSQHCRTSEEIRQALLDPPRRDSAQLNDIMRRCIGDVDVDVIRDTFQRQDKAA
ncbi:MAG: hypothetical protein GC182_07205 [Rhodopseudomonas sp.]|nr:hypothetical protein [Rhodopseudomonas sp.]